MLSPSRAVKVARLMTPSGLERFRRIQDELRARTHFGMDREQARRMTFVRFLVRDGRLTEWGR